MLHRSNDPVSIKDSKGFTLIEILFVMIIFITISSITIAFTPHVITKEHAPDFLRQLESDLYYIQQFAINHQQTVNLTLDLTNNRYFASTPSGGKLVEQKVPTGIKIEYGSLNTFTLFITLNGNFTHSGTWLVKEKGKVYCFYFLIGKGRFYFNEL
ncbi:competence type IV pilus minor pilin ComGD [Peribacillus alkalitolerans]|uniref:competence type IV pilus minor pilin ComGD n=1 Tax=Peribacillus alkalitolerans TaxID=1550385 RepID=UPI0013D00FCF|nr:competence type IV pilus minor pilin ComGD [Peribacillus alkalitolerans]